MRTTAALLALSGVLGVARAEDDAPRVRILGISHVAFRVSDIAASFRFYDDFLGLLASPATRGDHPPLLVRVNERQAIELRPGLVASEDRLDHIAFQVDDLEAGRRALAARGAKCLERERYGCFLRDTEGHDVELVSHSSPAGLPAAAALPPASAREGGPVSRRILHAGLLVGALEETRRFYEALGFRETWRGSRSGTELSWTNMMVPDGDDYVEFMLYAVKPAPYDRGVQHHVCLEVPDVEAARAVLLKRVEATGYSRPLEVRIGRTGAAR